ncbi:MAG: DUF3859 domain-containing protein [Myxacorys californica WJT36-NPBG1]|jgi:hypothetical protein|nr:DUF3859 domain-containing protein [Myxacorys californica WJT36-NPBG1]
MQKLTQEQLTQIVAEAQRISNKRQDELDADEVRQILQELNLPLELLEESLMQVRRQQSLQVEQRRNRWIVGGVVATIIVAITSILYFLNHQQQTLNRVSVERDRITLQVDGSDVQTVSRQSNPDLYYRVVLKDAPIGQKLSLSCEWIDPNQQIVKQNRYETQEIRTALWNTYCHYPIGTTAIPGTWTVRMRLNDRPISDASFMVQ